MSHILVSMTSFALELWKRVLLMDIGPNILKAIFAEQGTREATTLMGHSFSAGRPIYKLDIASSSDGIYHG